ncbi:MAG: T9SS type A sorting domain-containing protein, partial [Candidatus Marinimicrobia bacterium]|nr:T9SS type A sorting domain-containing protein [Candidatus Neomarinimicrobiota bacterium]
KGYKTVAGNEIKLFTVTLESKVADPERPDIYNARLVNMMNKAIDAKLMEANLPSEFSLEGNYPNPFNPITNIKFALPKAANVKLTVYNMLGQKVKTLVSKDMKAGRYNVQWNARNELGTRVASGLYFYRMQVGGKHIGSKKMVLMK